MVSNALAAAAVGRAFGLAGEDIASGITEYTPVSRRMNVLRLDKLTVIDDSYNANPAAMEAALDVLAHTPGRRVAILGDMLELGEGAATYHEQVGWYAASLGIDVILCAGPLAQNYASGAAGGRGVVAAFPDQAALLRDLAAWIEDGDTVLVKASLGMGFNQTVAWLQARRPGG